MNEQALKERIRYIAKTEGRKFNQVWRDLILERFLVRLSCSRYNKQFIFKGGLLLSHYIDLGRETKDADFLIFQLDGNASKIQKAFEEICKTQIEDGFIFTFSEIEPLDSGHRVNLFLKFGDMKDKIQVDIGSGDMVKPREESLELFQYKGKPIFEGSVSLQVYPVETIFAEKLQSILSRGAANSRMKDYHDLLLLSREKDIFDLLKLKGDIATTFESRKTNLDLPITFSKDDFTRLQVLWSSHRNGIKTIADTINLPHNIDELVAEINEWLRKNSISK